jgi:hypothetical protein
MKKNKRQLVRSSDVIKASFKKNNATNWNYKMPPIAAYGSLTQKDWNQTLFTKINELSIAVQTDSLKKGFHYPNGADTLIVSPTAYAIIEDMSYFVPLRADDSHGRDGVLGSRYDVFLDYDGLMKTKLSTKRFLLLENKEAPFRFSDDFVLVVNTKSMCSGIISIDGIC